MATTALWIACVALAGAIASWVAGAAFYARALWASGEGRGSLPWLAVAVWPFATGRLKQGAGSVPVNKALVALLAFTLVAAAAGAVATNLQRISK